MSSSNPIRALFGIAAVAGVVGAQGCVADRPSRNGVFNENQYIRKDFLVQPGAGGGDPGWFMKATVVQTSTPTRSRTSASSPGREQRGNPGLREHRPVGHHVGQAGACSTCASCRTPRHQRAGHAHAFGHQRLAHHERRPEVPGQPRRREDELLRGEPGARLAGAPVGEGQLRQERPQRRRGIGAYQALFSTSAATRSTARRRSSPTRSWSDDRQRRTTCSGRSRSRSRWT
jgi:hypothetical protein